MLFHTGTHFLLHNCSIVPGTTVVLAFTLVGLLCCPILGELELISFQFQSATWYELGIPIPICTNNRLANTRVTGMEICKIGRFQTVTAELGGTECQIDSDIDKKSGQEQKI